MSSGIFIFTRDLRIEDNAALHELSKKCSKIYGIFVFTPEQMTKKNKYKSDRCVRFMVECINELKATIPLNIYYGSHIDVIQKLLDFDNSIEFVAMSKDYTPFAKKRETTISNKCKKLNQTFICVMNHCIVDPNKIFTNNNTPYEVLTPYYNKAVTLRGNVDIVPTVAKQKFLIDTNRPQVDMHQFYDKKQPVNKDLIGGRKNGLLKLRNLKNHKRYDTMRNRIDQPSTRLSAYLKFGVIGIRETFHAVKKALVGNEACEALNRELHVRDFCMYICHHFPHVFGKNFDQKKDYDRLWTNDKKAIKAWKEGRTGIPIVDAAMRELNETGFMHNRGRMITAMFLTKNLKCDWRIGEMYFAQKLIDYDPCSNNGGWQWSASTGADGAQYTRIMNPYTQAKKVDPQSIYINNYLADDTMEHIDPIVDVKETRLEMINMFKKL